MARQVFYSFHYEPDNWRVAQVRNIGAVEGNEREAAKRDEDEIKRWIANQMEGRTCTVVLVGEKTANRKWINHEIVKSWNDGMGLVGVHIHWLRDLGGKTSHKGKNPFDFIRFQSNESMSKVVKCYDPQGNTDHERYNWIYKHLPRIVEEAMGLRERHRERLA